MLESAAATATLSKFGVAIGGFIGAILSLSFIKSLTRGQAVVAVVTGFACSVFTTPLTIAYFSLPSDDHSRYGVAFLIGLLAMNVIPGIKAAANRVISAWGVQ